MVKDLRKYMRTDDNYIEKFSNVCDEMMHSRYILADSKISAFLQTVAGDVTLYDFFKTILNNFDFAYELNKCKIPGGYNTYKINLPRDKRKTAALVFSILFAFDTNQMSLKDFLHEFYFSEAGANTEYESFVKEVLFPFKTSVLDIWRGEDEPEITPSDEFFEKTDKELDGRAVEDLVTVMSEVIRFIRESHNINASERDELLLVSEGLNNTVYTKNKKLILVLFIGCKNTVKMSKLSRELLPNIELLESKLQSYGIMG